MPSNGNTNDTRKIILEVPHDNLLPFLREHIQWRTRWGFIYWLLNIVLVCLAIYFMIARQIPVHEAFFKVGLGFALFIMVIPLHEAIHGIAYRMMGAAQVVYKAQWRKMIFYAAAPHFVVHQKQFNIIALAPFTIINTGLLVLSMCFSQPASLVFLGALIAHTGGCFGDFALVSYMYENRKLNIATMDDMTTNKTYFFTYE